MALEETQNNPPETNLANGTNQKAAPAKNVEKQVSSAESSREKVQKLRLQS